MDRLQTYYKNALLANLCSEYKNRWKTASQDKKALFQLAMSQQSLPHLMTFAYNGKGLPKEYLEREFCDYINGKYKAIDADGVQDNYVTTLHVGIQGISEACGDVLAFMWANVPLLKIDACKCPKIYIGCKSNVNMSLQGYNSITVMLFDESKVKIDECDETCSVNIYKYGQKAHVDIDQFCLAKVKIHEKQLRL